MVASDGTAALFRLVARGASPVVPFNQTRKGIPFYSVHALGGGAPSHEFMCKLGDDAPVFGIQAPRELFRSPGVTSVEDLARYYVETIVAAQPRGALMLGGDSVGATIALEMAQQLRAKEREVALLVVFDGILHNWEGVVVDFRPSFLLKWIGNVPQWLFHNIWWEDGARRSIRKVGRLLRTKNKARKLSDAARATLAGFRWRQEVRGKHGVLRALNPQAPDSQIWFSRTLWDAAEAYVPRRYDGPVMLYLARTRPLMPSRWNLGVMVREFQIEAAWRSICHNLSVVSAWGTHATMLDGRWVGPLASDLRKRFAEVRRAHADSDRLLVGGEVEPCPANGTAVRCAALL